MIALLLHSDNDIISKLQVALLEKGFVTIVAGELPQALSAMTEHYFEIAIVSSQLAKGGDGWTLAGVLHLVFSRAFVCVVSPTEPDVLPLRTAISSVVR